jgi:hypothetical protein
MMLLYVIKNQYVSAMNVINYTSFNLMEIKISVKLTKIIQILILKLVFDIRENLYLFLLFYGFFN